MKVIRRGVTRTVILTRRWAIKVPTIRGLGTADATGRVASFCRGVLANQSEQQWSGVRGFNPVVWSLLGIVNVSRRAEPVSDVEHIDYDTIAETFAPIGDRKPDNLGILDGRLVWIDFDYSWNGICTHPDHQPV